MASVADSKLTTPLVGAPAKPSFRWVPLGAQERGGLPDEDPWSPGAPSSWQITGDPDAAGYGARKPRDPWCVSRPSRQNTGDSVGSTAASEGDLLGSPQLGRLMGIGGPNSPTLHTRRALVPVNERRGWKYFFQHTLRIPLAFAAGVVLGVGCFLLLRGQTAVAFHAPAGTGAPAYPAVPAPLEVPKEYLAAPGFDNACLIQKLKIPEGPRTFDACGFVINSTDAVWNRRGGDVDAAIDRYFHSGYLNAGSWGRRGVGKAALRSAVFSEMRGFPDIRIHITDCQCAGNDVDGYKCSMPDILEGTNTGPSAYGPATGRYARWTGMVQSFVKRDPLSGQWQYYAEWGVHDEWALIQQLGLDFARVPHPPTNTEPFHDCTPILSLAPPSLDAEDSRVDPAVAKSAAVVS